MGRRLRCPGLAARPPECGSLFSPTQSAQLPTWNKALSQKAQEKSQMLTHLPDMGMLQPKCLEACAGGLAGQAPCGPEIQLHGAASKSQAFFPERFRFERLNRFRWAYPLLLLLHPLALKISETVSFTFTFGWQTGFLESPPDFMSSPPPWCALLTESPGLRIWRILLPWWGYVIWYSWSSEMEII